MHTTNYLVPVYAAYAGSALLLTAWLARVFFRNGALFLEDVFVDKPELAHAVNRMLVTGFYMLNLGYALVTLKAGKAATSTRGIEILATKLGFLLLTLAAVHFVNMAVFWKLRHRNAVRTLPPPLAPQQFLAPPPNPGGPAGPAPQHARPAQPIQPPRPAGPGRPMPFPTAGA